MGALKQQRLTICVRTELAFRCGSARTISRGVRSSRHVRGRFAELPPGPPDAPASSHLARKYTVDKLDNQLDILNSFSRATRVSAPTSGSHRRLWGPTSV